MTNENKQFKKIIIKEEPKEIILVLIGWIKINLKKF